MMIVFIIFDTVNKLTVMVNVEDLGLIRTNAEVSRFDTFTVITPNGNHLVSKSTYDKIEQLLAEMAQNKRILVYSTLESANNGS